MADHAIIPSVPCVIVYFMVHYERQTNRQTGENAPSAGTERSEQVSVRATSTLKRFFWEKLDLRRPFTCLHVEQRAMHRQTD